MFGLKVHMFKYLAVAITFALPVAAQNEAIADNATVLDLVRDLCIEPLATGNSIVPQSEAVDQQISNGMTTTYYLVGYKNVMLGVGDQPGRCQIVASLGPRLSSGLEDQRGTSWRSRVLDAFNTRDLIIVGRSSLGFLTSQEEVMTIEFTNHNNGGMWSVFSDAEHSALEQLRNAPVLEPKSLWDRFRETLEE